MKRLSVFGLLVGLVASGISQSNSTNELIFTDKDAVGLMPPIVVSNGMVSTTEWSPDGKMLLISSLEMKLTPAIMADYVAKGAVGTPPVPPMQHLQLFNVDRQTTVTVFKRPMQEGTLSDIEWLPGGRAALVLVEVPRPPVEGKPADTFTVIYTLNAASGKLTPLIQAQEQEFISIDVEDKGAMIVTRKYPENTTPDTIQSRFTLVTSDGRLGNSIQTVGRTGIGQIAWISGNRPMMYRAVREQPNEKAKLAWFDMDFASGQLKPAADPNYKVTADVPVAFSVLIGGSLSATEGKSVTNRAAWLVARERGPHQSALVAADVDDARLSPGLNAVFYSTKGVGMVRLLMKLPKEVALKSLAEAEKMKVMNDAKQVGMALHMYAADMDDNIPSNGSDWMTALNPYLKNNSPMEGFVYTYGGGNLANVENPATTELGFKHGPGGRAVVYADGHVKWIPDK